MTRDEVEDATRWLADKQAQMEKILAELVCVNSFTENPDGGRAVGRLLKENVFAIEGLTCATHPSERFADHLVFTANSIVGPSPIALVGHLDTVFPPGTFEGFRRDGELARGPGVLDMKGGLVVVAFALRAIASTHGLSAIGPLRLLIVADEEVGSPEGRGLIERSIGGADACLVFEAGRKGDAIITMRKGTGGIKAIAHGKGAHAGNGHAEGKNAIWVLARFVDQVQKLTDYNSGITVNVGKISGGQGKNTVPDHAEADLDIRFCKRSDGEALVSAIRSAAETAARDVQGTRIEIEGGIAREPLERSESSRRLFHAYGESARLSGLGFSEAPLIGGGSDASTSSAMGIPSIDGLGPRGIGFHTRDEQIEVASLVPKAAALARFLLARARLGKT